MIYSTFSGIESNINVKIEDAYKKIMNQENNDDKNFYIINITGNIPKTKIGDKELENVMVLLPKIKYIFKENKK